MERARREQRGGTSSATSELIAQLAAARERKLKQQSDVAAASALPLPSGAGDAPARTRLVRRDRQQQAQRQEAEPAAAAAAAAGAGAELELDELASMLQGVGLQGSAAAAPRAPASATAASAAGDPESSSDSDGSSAAGLILRHRAPPQAPSPRSASASSSGADSDDSSSRAASGRGRAASGASCGSGSSSSAADCLVLDGGFCLDGRVARKLYAHQVQGVKWLWSLHSMGKGGILADDMGLGKTMQCSAFLAGALRPAHASASASSGGGPAAAAAAAAPRPVRALIVAPKTLLAHWESELRVCGLGPATHSFYSSSEGERSAALRAITRRGGVLLTTYGMVLHNAAQLRAGLGSAVARELDDEETDDDPLCPEPPPGRRLLWDYVILDEGHKIKNAATQLAQRMREIRARVRVIISGTPVQNNLAELHALLDFAVPGLLGAAREFKAAFDKPINAGQDRSASLRVRELGAARAAELRRLTAPFVLRREKREVLGSGGNGSSSSASTGAAASDTAASGSSGGHAGGVVAAAAAGLPAASEGSTAAAGPAPPAPAAMGSKTDLVVWLRLQPLQRHIYEAFLHSDAVKAALNSSRSPLAALTVLKKVCDHPALLSERATHLVVSAASKQGRSKQQPGKRPGKQPQRRSSLDDFIVSDGQEGDSEDERSDDDGSSCGASDDASDADHSPTAARARAAAASRAALAASLDAGFSDEFVSWAAAGGEGLEARLLDDMRARGTEASCKALLVDQLLAALVADGHRTLVFSQSRVMLDILQAAVVARGWAFCRIDGSMAKPEARQAEVQRFQAAGCDIPVFLLTTQVGGLGLTLTAANRVVIVDPSWNPATDNQSVDRAYRIGQSRDVLVYRLVTCGTVEEKIYRKQVFKGGLSKAGMEEGVQLRYFTHQELHELFKWDPDALNSSETQQLLVQQPQQASQRAPELRAHIAWLERHPLCAGTSEHGLLFSQLDPEGRQLNLQAQPTAASALQDLAQRGGGGRGPAAGRAGGGPARGAPQPSPAVLGELMASLNLSLGGSSGAAGGSASSAGAQEQAAALQRRIKQLEAQLANATSNLQLLGPRLPDGGAKLLQQQHDLRASLAEAQQQLRQLDPCAAAGAGPAALSDISNQQQQQQQQQLQVQVPAAAAGAADCRPQLPSSVAAVGGGSQQRLPLSQQVQGQRQQAGWLQQLPLPPQAAPAPPLQRDRPQPPQRQAQPPPQQQQQQPPPQRQPPPPQQQQQQQQPRPGAAGALEGVRTLDGRTPSLAELKQRKHVLKKALQREDEAKALLRSAGQPWPAERQVRWLAMYEEYKELKGLLLAAQQQAEAQQAAGGGAREVIDLT